jgi:hypothetical protein
MGIASQAFVYKTISGKSFWRLLSRPRVSVQKIISPRHCPNEFLYKFNADSQFSESTLPPILYVALPHLTDNPETVYFELEPVICARPRSRLGDHYRFLFEWLCWRFQKSMWVERTGGSLAMMPGMHKTFPNAKFVHVFRDGRDVSLSISQHPPMRLLVNSWHRFRKLGIDPMRPPFRVGESRIISAFESLAAPLVNLDELLEEEVPLSAIGEFWSKLIIVGKKNLDNLPPHQRLDLRYEELIENPIEQIKKLALFLDPAFCNQKWLAQAASLVRRQRNGLRTLQPCEEGALEEACAPGLRALNYKLTQSSIAMQRTPCRHGHRTRCQS